MTRPKICYIFLLSFLLVNTSANAGTIIKLGFSNDARPDIELVSGILSTVDDGIAATAGDQNTGVIFDAELSGEPSLSDSVASVSFNNISLMGENTTIANTVLQETMGGDFSLYGEANELLLTGTLGNGLLHGPIGGTATGGFLTTEFGAFTGGSLLPSLNGMNLSAVSISLSNVNGRSGLATNDDGTIQDFTADATANIVASPEPSASLMTVVGVVGCMLFARRRR